MGKRESKGEPVPYTAPDYDPDGSGRPAADAPDSATAASGALTSSPAAGEQTRLDKEPQPYVDPAYDPARS